MSEERARESGLEGTAAACGWEWGLDIGGWGAF